MYRRLILSQLAKTPAIPAGDFTLMQLLVRKFNSGYFLHIQALGIKTLVAKHYCNRYNFDSYTNKGLEMKHSYLLTDKDTGEIIEVSLFDTGEDLKVTLFEGEKKAPNEEALS